MMYLTWNALHAGCINMIRDQKSNKINTCNTVTYWTVFVSDVTFNLAEINMHVETYRW